MFDEINKKRDKIIERVSGRLHNKVNILDYASRKEINDGKKKILKEIN